MAIGFSRGVLDDRKSQRRSFWGGYGWLVAGWIVVIPIAIEWMTGGNYACRYFKEGYETVCGSDIKRTVFLARRRLGEEGADSLAVVLLRFQVVWSLLLWLFAFVMYGFAHMHSTSCGFF